MYRKRKEKRRLYGACSSMYDRNGQKSGDERPGRGRGESGSIVGQREAAEERRINYIFIVILKGQSSTILIH